MKEQSNNTSASICGEKTASIKNSVNETLASFFTQTYCKTFTAADLWNIQQQGKSCNQRKHSL